MSAEPAPLRHLVSVDSDSGEVVSREVATLQERVASLEATIKDLEKDLRVKRAQITKLNKDAIKERFDYRRADDVRRVHDYWNRRLGHKQGLTADRFDAVRGILEERDLAIVDGKAKKVAVFAFPEDFKLAIDGAWFDPFTTKRKNGTVHRHDDLALICKDAKTFRSFMARAPVRADQG